MTGLVSVILPAHDEAAYIGACLDALLASDAPAYGWSVEVIVVANGCSDRTADIARGRVRQATARGWRLVVLDLAEGGKLNALNKGEAAAAGATRVYLDADVIVSPPLIAQLVEVLDTGQPRYASGQPRLARASSPVTAAYGRFWATLPFVTNGVPGFGIFAVNPAGRARWATFPDIISDDTFVRLMFTPAQRFRVAAEYSWPMVEGFRNLVRVRRRQNAGVDQIATVAPTLLRNDDKAPVGIMGVLRRALRHPVGFAVYAAVAIAVRSPYARSSSAWARGR